ncbi:hypothetical protein BCR32DRAFT_270331, partial [Anaeromyces robustus]
MGKHSHSHSHRDHDKKRKRRKHNHEKHKKRHNSSSSSSSSSSEEELQWEEKIIDTTSSTSQINNDNNTTTETHIIESQNDMQIENNNNINEETINEKKIIGPSNVQNNDTNMNMNTNTNDTHSLLTSDIFENIFTSNVKTKQELRVEKAKKEEEDKEKRRLALELNPYFKNGGKGVPTEDNEAEEKDKPSKPKYTIGDAGSKWRMIKLRRVFEMAKEEGKPVEEIALMRYG